MMGVLILAPIQATPAGATFATAGNTVLTVQSGSLIIFASDSQTLVNPGNFHSTAITNGVKTFFVNNSGSFGVSRFELTINLPKNSNVSSFKRCDVGVAFIGNNSCATGSPTSVVINPGASTTYLLSLPKNGFYSFQISQNKSGTLEVHAAANTAYIANTVTSS